VHLRAISPSIRYEQAFLAMLDDFDRNDPNSAEFYAPAKANFAGYARSLLDEARGLNLPDGWVPCTHRWLVAPSEQIVGVTRLRHNIDTPFLSENGGHVGFDVAPSHRRRGYGHFALSVALAEAERLDIDRVLLYTAMDNAASRAVIERAGGQLERIAYSEFWHEQLCKYWLVVKSAA
jgi:predicted acetyltransferase